MDINAVGGSNTSSRDKVDQTLYWSNVILKGLKDQACLIERSKHLIDRMSDDEFTHHKNSAYKKIQKALVESSVHPLRELKTKEKVVLVQDVKQKLNQGFTTLVILY